MLLQLVKLNFDMSFSIFEKKILKFETRVTSPFIIVVTEDRDCFIAKVEQIDHQLILKKVTNNHKIGDLLCNEDKYFSVDRDLVDIEFSDIKSISMYISNLKEALEVTEWINENSQKVLLYRGQANEQWGIESSLFRFGYEETKESKLYSEIQHMNHEKFNSKDFMTIATQMQHYGIPTRLIDWTGNILNAIYFSCVSSAENFNENGIIFITFDTELIETDSVTYNNIEKFLKYRFTKRSNISDSVDKMTSELFPILSEVYFRKERYKFFKTPLSNERIKSQDGYFSVCFESSTEEATSFLRHEVKEYIERNKINIRKELLEKLIEDLESPLSLQKIEDFITVIRYLSENNQITQSNFNELEEAMKRFSTIRPLKHSMNDLQKFERVVKLVIPKEYKMKIITELDNVGVNSSTIYPDLEGMAKYINEKYSVRKGVGKNGI